jgi:hypothetical protein
MTADNSQQNVPHAAHAAGITAVSVGGYKSIRHDLTLQIRPMTILAGPSFQQALNSADHLRAQSLSTCDHASVLAPLIHGVQKKEVGNAQGKAGGSLIIISSQ